LFRFTRGLLALTGQLKCSVIFFRDEYKSVLENRQASAKPREVFHGRRRSRDHVMNGHFAVVSLMEQTPLSRSTGIRQVTLTSDWL